MECGEKESKKLLELCRVLVLFELFDDLIEGKSPEMSLSKMTEEAFALLHAEGEPTPKEAVTAAMNPLYIH